MSFEKERQFYRLLLPPGDVVTIQVGTHRMPVLEISERGVRYDPAPGHEFVAGEDVTALVRLKTIGEFEVTGKVSRQQGRSVIMVLDPPGVPYATLLGLQLYLRKHYPDRH